mmetsp:Transcript_17198/g.39751  ORF Transcript_17198/g.39751 Transcript_17198/m.39751 type:complete len:202 (+) Transcript_17198:449-1054(+)
MIMNMNMIKMNNDEDEDDDENDNSSSSNKNDSSNNSKCDGLGSAHPHASLHGCRERACHGYRSTGNRRNDSRLRLRLRPHPGELCVAPKPRGEVSIRPCCHGQTHLHRPHERGRGCTQWSVVGGEAACARAAELEPVAESGSEARDRVGVLATQARASGERVDLARVRLELAQRDWRGRWRRHGAIGQRACGAGDVCEAEQ